MHSDSNEPLALSEIMHTLSPSPGPSSARRDAPNSEEDIPTEPTATLPNDTSDDEPDALSDSELQAMHHRLEQVGLAPSQQAASSSSLSSHPTPLEIELGSMVSRLLLQYNRMSPEQYSEQLASQAAIIASLAAQRDLLVQQHADARAEWDVERQGWERSSEALIRQRAAAAAITKEEIVDRLVARLEDENRRLRNKISGLWSRLLNFEEELYKLRPLLLIPPVAGSGGRPNPVPKTEKETILEASEPSITITPALAEESVSAEGNAETSDIPGPSASQTTEPDTFASSSSHTLSTQPTHSSTLSSQSQPPMPPSPPPSARANSYYRTPRERELDLAIPTPRKTRAAAQPPPPPHAGSSTAQVLHPAWQPQTRSDERVAASLLSDARAELMLHAARRIGKRRTGALAGLVLRPESAPVTPQEGAKSKGKERAGSRASDKGKGRAHPAEEDVLPVKKQRKRAVKKANTMPKVASSSTAATAPTNASSGYYGTLPGMSHLLYVNPLHTGQRMPAGGALPVFMPLGGWPPAAPGAPGSPQRKPDAPAESSTPARAPPTPGLRRSESAASQGLDSLLSAARMLADDAGPSADGGGGGTPARRAHDLLDTPTPKRRRVEGGTPGSLGDAGAEAGETGDASPRTPTPAGRGRALGRISSALDVLADQAAQEQERRPATPSRPAAAPTSEQRLGRSRGRTRRGKGREAAEGSASRQSSPVRQVSTEPNSSREGTPPPSSIVSVAQQRGGPVVGTRSLPAPSASSANRLAVPVVERAVSSDADAPGSPENSMDVGD